MFKNTRLSAFLAAVLLSVTAASALVSAPAFAQETPATDAAAPAATDAAAPAVDPAAAPADAAAAPADAGAPAAAPGGEQTEEVYNPYGLQAMWEHGDFVNKGTLIILSLMSIG